MKELSPWAGVAALALAFPADAAGPYVVDDADITPSGKCQVETWVATSDHATTTVAAPACTPAFRPRTELTLNGRTGDDETTFGLGAKWNLKPFDGGRLAASLSAQADWDLRHDEVALLAFNAPVSVGLRDGVQFHLNAGLAYDPRTQTGRATWGIALDARATPRLTLAAEMFGDSLGAVGWQAGLRPHLVPDRLDLDLTIGQPNTASDALWTTVGLALAF